MRIASVFVWLLRASLLMVFLVGITEACMCMLQHPQEHYCKADYVALVKVLYERKNDGYTRPYQVKVKKEFKMTEKAKHALSQEVIYAPIPDSLCGITLTPGNRYLLAGRVDGKKAVINMCNLAMEWSTVTPKQKRGFRRLYQQGCQCKVRSWMHSHYASKQKTSSTCRWDTASFQDSDKDCQKFHSFCAPSARHDNRCTWIKNKAYRQCMKERAAEREREP